MKDLFGKFKEYKNIFGKLKFKGTSLFDYFATIALAFVVTYMSNIHYNSFYYRNSVALSSRD